MSISDLFHFLTELIRNDASALAGFFLGILLGSVTIYYFFVCGKSRSKAGDKKLKRLQEQLAEAREQVDASAKQIQELTVAAVESKAEKEAAISEKELLGEQVTDLKKTLGARGEELQKKKAECVHWYKASVKLQEEAKALNPQNTKLQEEAKALNLQYENLTIAAQTADKKAHDAIQDLQVLSGEKQKVDKELTKALEEIERLKKPSEGGGRIWDRSIAATAPPFTALKERNMPIISIFNLKGGVGKTTVTLNLGATLGAECGKGVLLVDLDFQRSLSALCLTAKEMIDLHDQKRCLQHFLSGLERDATGLRLCVAPIDKAPGCSIVVNSDPKEEEDGLEETETRLTHEWNLRPDALDVRLLLRKALHAPEFQDRFDYVLLDCPPRLNLACINALAASDYVLIPVLPDWTSAMSVPRVLQALKRLRSRKVLPQLRVLGVVANRTKVVAGNLVAKEQKVLDFLPKMCKQVWGSPVHFFKTTIKQAAAICPPINSPSIAVSDDVTVADNFHQLVKEMKARIKNESGHPTAVPS